MNRQNFKNGLSKFPVSTDTFDFMQEQIYLVARFAEAMGANVIIKLPTADTDGLVIVDGELLPFKKGFNPKPCIGIAEERPVINAGEQTFEDTRIVRYARYDVSGTPLSSFTTLQSMVQLMGRIAAIENNYVAQAAFATVVDSLLSDIATANVRIDGLDTRVTNLENTYVTQDFMSQVVDVITAHLVPKRAVISWYHSGVTLTPSDLPAGFVPCGRFVTHPNDTTWASLYPDSEYSNAPHGTLRKWVFTRANGVVVPFPDEDSWTFLSGVNYLLRLIKVI